LVISTSGKIIFLAKKYGWKDINLIKICLPKWDKFDNIKNKQIKRKNRSIFIFFTWRQWKKNINEEVKLKSQYFQKIVELMNDKLLSDSLKNNEITVHFCLHHKFNIYKNKINFGNNNIKFIKQTEIFKTIINSDLLVTDFSSIIFEFMYQKKPFIMFLPDSEDPNINKLYNSNYFTLVRDLKEGKIDFMNKYFTVNQTVFKIINYINNNLKIENELFEFYQSFNLTCGNNTNKFINYLENL
jgi:CDP-glycerol glycerophosphotransferase (TagB/SpsB family)